MYAFHIHTKPSDHEGGCWAGGADGIGGFWAEEKKGVCSGGNNRWTCTVGYGVSLITHPPHLLIYSNYLPTHWAPCQCWGVNTTDQIHLKIKVPTHSATPTPAFYSGLAALEAVSVWRSGGVKCEKIRGSVWQKHREGRKDGKSARGKKKGGGGKRYDTKDRISLRPWRMQWWQH